MSNLEDFLNLTKIELKKKNLITDFSFSRKFVSVAPSEEFCTRNGNFEIKYKFLKTNVILRAQYKYLQTYECRNKPFINRKIILTTIPANKILFNWTEGIKNNVVERNGILELINQLTNKYANQWEHLMFL
tara:strand:- start:98 stop:490 length:393 start_codon:yes stop_codon:yes gene_type:complete